MSRSSSKPKHKYAELPVNAIACYANNPRVTRNPEYERLKESLEKNGLDAPLAVTRKPGDKDYTLQAGGNTRLSILQALHEAGDKTFANVPCIVKPWTSDKDVLVSHLRENDLRGNLTFIERALGIADFAKLAIPKGETSMTQRALVKHLKEHGYSLSQSVISAMDYTVNRLHSLLPTALAKGMGKRQVVAIRSLERSAAKVWQRHCPGVDDFHELFDELVKRCDGDTFDFEGLVSGVANEIAVEAELDINAVRLMLEAEQAGETLMVDDYAPVVTDNSRKPEKREQRRTFNLGRELQKSRAKAIEACIALATQFDLSSYVEVSTDERFGYYMRELPPNRATKVQLGVWKLLAAACDQGKASKRVLLQLIEPDSRFAAALARRGTRSVCAELQSFDLLDIGERMLRVVDDVAWSNVVKLLSAYRRMRVLADEHDLNLWDLSR